MPTEIAVLPMTVSNDVSTWANDTEHNPTLSGRGGMRVSQVSGPMHAAALAGRLYVISAGVVANAKVPIVDLGTTTAAWALWNGNAVTTRYVLTPRRVTVHLASGTGDIGASLWVGMSPTVQASALTAATGTVGPKSTSGSSRRTSLGLIAGAVTLAGAPAWVPVGGFGNHAAAATPGSCGTFDLDGEIIIPPWFACGFTVVSGLGTTAKYAVSVWYEETEETVQ